MDANGYPLAGAKLFFYVAGTTTPITTYQDQQATTPHANPVLGDSTGTFPPIYLVASSDRFKIVLKTAGDVTVQTIDRILVGGAVSDGTIFRPNLSAPFQGVVPYSPGEAGAAGDGTTNDTADVNFALASAGSGGELYLPQDKEYLVTSFPNLTGVEILGPGKIVKAVTGGTQQINSYADLGRRHVYNLEYFMSAYRLLKAAKDSNWQDIQYLLAWDCYGDSTVAGGYGEDRKVHEVINNYLRDLGLPLTLATNYGVANTTWADIDSMPTHSAQGGVDIFKFFMNRNPTDTVDDEIAIADARLTTWRAATNGNRYTRDLIICTSNSSTDTPNGRDEARQEQVLKKLIWLGHKHNAVVWDCYGMARDLRAYIGVLLDNPYADGVRGVHPKDSLNLVMIGGLMAATLPRATVIPYSTNRFENNSIITATIPAATTPSFMDVGEKWYASTTGNGFPVPGWLRVSKQADGVTQQQIAPYDGTPRILTRQAKTADNTWTAFTGLPTAVPLSNGWANKGSGYLDLKVTLTIDGLCHIGGAISGGTTTASTTIATIPAGFRPAGATHFSVQSSSSSEITVIVGASGNIVLGETGDATTMAFEAVYRVVA